MSLAIRRRGVFLWAVLVVVGANYLAQIPYYLHLYYIPHGALPSLRGSILLGLTLAWFLAGALGFARGRVWGSWLLATFLLTEVSFYALNMLNQTLHGFPPFFHLQTRDPILFVVFGIGYLNMLAGAYFLFVLLQRQADFSVRRAEPPAQAG